MSGEAPPAQELTGSDVEVQEVALTRRQPLLPLFLLAVGVIAVGFYISLSRVAALDQERTPAQVHPAVAPAQLPEGLTPLTEPPQATLAFGPLPKANYRYTLTQTSSRQVEGEAPSSHLTTQLSFLTHFTPQDAPEDASKEGRELAGRHDYHATFSDASFQISIADEGAPHLLGPEITRQLGPMLERASMRFSLDKVGHFEELRWENKVNPQNRLALGLVEDAMRLLNPILPREPINVGERWTYEIALPGADEQGVSVEGSLTLVNELLGRVDEPGRELWLVSQRVEVRGEGAFSHAEQGKITYTLSGGGEGLVRFDAAARRLDAYGLELVVETLTRGEQLAPVTRRAQYTLGVRLQPETP